MEELKKGDKVRLTDGSFSVNVSDLGGHAVNGIDKDIFVVVETIPSSLDYYSDGVHNLFIRKIKTGVIYLHSKCMVEKIEAEAIEITMAEVEEKFGCKCKIIK